MAAAFFAGAAWAGQPENVNQGEAQLVAPYCWDTWGFANPTTWGPRASYWEGLMGETFHHMHHYCWAMINIKRAQTRPEHERRGIYAEARRDLIYVINGSPPTFPLLPELFTRVGEVDLLLKNFGSADQALQRARALKPDYWQAYAPWIETLIKLNLKPAAKELAIEGLKYSPQAPVLLDQFKRLGGKPSELKTLPASTAAAPASAPASPASAAAPAEAAASAAAR